MPVLSVIILLALWLIGDVTDHTFGGLLHILFLIALVLYGIILIVEKTQYLGRTTSEKRRFLNLSFSGKGRVAFPRDTR